MASHAPSGMTSSGGETNPLPAEQRTVPQTTVPLPRLLRQTPLLIVPYSLFQEIPRCP